MVAPSFKSFEMVSEIYSKSGKSYVDVKNPKTAKVRSVRWYTDEEYAKAYPTAPIKRKVVETNPAIPYKYMGAPIITDIMDNLRQVRGFSLGPIKVVYGDVEKNEMWLKTSNARWAQGIGWHFVSEEEMPVLPEGLHYVGLDWDEAKDYLFKYEQLEKIIKEKIKCAQ